MYDRNGTAALKRLIGSAGAVSHRPSSFRAVYFVTAHQGLPFCDGHGRGAIYDTWVL